MLASQPFSRLVGAELGTMLMARATVVHVGKSQAVCRCDVLALKDGAKVLVAVAQGTIARLGGGAGEG